MKELCAKLKRPNTKNQHSMIYFCKMFKISMSRGIWLTRRMGDWGVTENGCRLFLWSGCSEIR
jgi:hypothetical protein